MCLDLGSRALMKSCLLRSLAYPGRKPTDQKLRMAESKLLQGRHCLGELPVPSLAWYPLYSWHPIDSGSPQQPMCSQKSTFVRLMSPKGSRGAHHPANEIRP